jgi:hypothetical protein
MYTFSVDGGNPKALNYNGGSTFNASLSVGVVNREVIGCLFNFDKHRRDFKR